MTQKGEIPLEARLYLVEKDIELLKLRDTDIRTWQESVNRTSYKIEALEKSLDDTRERFDEIKDIFKNNIIGQKEMQDTLIQKIEQINKTEKPPEEKAKNNVQNIVELVAKIIFILLVLAAGFLGIKLPGVTQ